MSTIEKIYIFKFNNHVHTNEFILEMEIYKTNLVELQFDQSGEIIYMKRL